MGKAFFLTASAANFSAIVIGTTLNGHQTKMPDKLNKIYEGFNTITNELECWKCIKVKTNYNINIMQQLFLIKKKKHLTLTK